jgi:hypothetical protein
VIWTAALLFPIVVTIALIPIVNAWQPVPPSQIDVAVRITDCRAETIRRLNPDKPSIELYRELSAHCYMQVRGEALLIDFNIRRLNLINQQIDGRVILWMVVAITISGIILAAFQLLAAFRLASAGKGELAQSQELTLEQNRISLKSSVTGLMIFVISFAFFMVYVVWVYTSKELKQELPEGPAQTTGAAAHTAGAVPFLGIGGAGYPQKQQTGAPNPASSPTPEVQ